MTKQEANVAAFLKLIRWCEHKKEDNDVYFILYGGGRFANMKTHPNIRVYDRNDVHKKHPHTPAGAYQITFATWLEANKKGIASDFTAESQDNIAVWLIKTEGALGSVEDGDIESAVNKLGGRWSSLPSAKQSHVSLSEAKAKFALYGGTCTVK